MPPQVYMYASIYVCVCVVPLAASNNAVKDRHLFTNEQQYRLSGWWWWTSTTYMSLPVQRIYNKINVCACTTAAYLAEKCLQ